MGFLVPSANFNGSTTITVVVDDGEASSSISFDVTIAAVNDHPSMVSISNISTLNEFALPFANFISSWNSGDDGPKLAIYHFISSSGNFELSSFDVINFAKCSACFCIGAWVLEIFSVLNSYFSPG